MHHHLSNHPVTSNPGLFFLIYILGQTNMPPFVITGMTANFSSDHFAESASLTNFNCLNYFLSEQCPSVPVYVFSDADIAERPEEVERILKDCKVLFCSLIVDFIQVQWIKQR